MALLIRFAVREIRDAFSNKSNPNSNPNRSDRNQHNNHSINNDPNTLQPQTSYDQGYRPSRKERRRQRKQSLRDMTYSPPCHRSRALGTNLASQSVDHGFHPTFDRGYSSSSYNSSHSHIYDNEPRGYSVSGGPAYGHAAHEGQTHGLRRQTSAPQQYYAPRDQYQYGELGRSNQERGYDSVSEHGELAPPPAYQKS